MLLRLELSHLCGSDLSEHDASILALQVTVHFTPSLLSCYLYDVHILYNRGTVHL